MENEVKEEVKVAEPKKKGNGLFTVFACVMTGVIVFLATNLGDKASKVVDPETNSGTTTTSNAPASTKLSDEEALKLGKEMFAKAQEVDPFNDFKEAEICNPVTVPGTDLHYECTSHYAKVKEVFAEENIGTYVNFDARSEIEYKNIFSYFVSKDGKYYLPDFGCCILRELTSTTTLKSNEENKIVLTNTYARKDNPSVTASFDFIIVKENGTWKVSQYIGVI